MDVPSSMRGNSSMFDVPIAYNVYRKYLIIVGWMIFMTVTAVGNLFVMIAYAKDRKIREFVPNMIILHLSIADFLVGTCSLLHPVAFHLNNDSLDLGEYGCKIYLIIDNVAVVLSMAMMLCISFDRYWIVTKNIKYRAFQTRGRVKKMIAASWVAIVGTYCFMILAWDLLPGQHVNVQFYDIDCQPAFLQSTTAILILSSLTGYIPLASVVILNTLIFIHLWNNSKVFQKVKLPSRRQLSGDSDSVQTEGTPDVYKVQPTERTVYTISRRKDSQQRPQDRLRELELRFRQNLRAAVKLAVLVVAFAICWIPLEVVGLYTLHCGECVSPDAFRMLAALQYFNSCLNPFLYAATNKRFRDHFKKFLKFRCC